VHLFGFIIRIYHDARSPERQIHHINKIESTHAFVRWQVSAECSGSLATVRRLYHGVRICCFIIFLCCANDKRAAVGGGGGVT